MNKLIIKKNRLQGICAIGAYFTINMIMPFILAILPIDYNNWSNNAKLLFNIGYDMLLIFIIYLVLKDTIKPSLENYLKNIKMYISRYIKYWFLALGLMFISNLIIIMFTQDIAKNEQTVRQLFDANPILTFFLASFLAPFLEEFIFRLSIYKILSNHKKLFIIVSGLVFGSMHVIGNVSVWTDVLYLVPYSIPGCVFAYTLVKSDNIFVPVSLHLFNNTFALILQFLASFSNLN